MRPLGVPPTVNQLSQQCTTDFLKTVAERCNMYSGTTNPTVSQIPNKQWVVFKNTTNGEVRLWTNDNGVLKSTLLTTNTVQPIFSASQQVATTIANAVNQIITFDTVEYDVGSGFSAGYHYQPSVPGYYQFNLNVSVANICLVELWLNGAIYRRGTQYTASANNQQAGMLSAIIKLNGTTDYVEPHVYQNSGANQVTAAGLSYFQGFWIRPL